MAKQVEDGEWLTTGDPATYLLAVLKYALDREDVAEVVQAYLRGAGLLGLSPGKAVQRVPADIGTGTLRVVKQTGAPSRPRDSVRED